MSSSHRLPLRLLIEYWGPFVGAVATIVCLFVYREFLVAKFSESVWNLTGLYSSIFGWSAIQTGFLFGVYGFIVGRSEGFIAEIKDTKFMKLYLRYTARATIIGFCLTIFSIPLMVVEPQLQPNDGWGFPIVAAWFSLFVWAFGAFLRVAYIFGIVVRVRDKERLDA